MTDVNLFLSVIKELQEKIDSQQEYDILRISDLLFKLIMDEDSLIDKVNNRRIKIEYEINERSVLSDPHLMYWSIEDGFDPQTSAPHLSNPKKVGKDRLLGQVVMTVNGNPIKIRDLITYIRNKEGGVHRGKVKKDKELILKQLYTELFIGGLPAGLRLLKAISRVVLKAIVELENLVRAELT